MNNPLIESLQAHRSDIIERWQVSQFDDALIRRYGIHGLESSDRNWIASAFLHPLLNLLIEYLRTGDERYRFVYQDERLRYAPHRAGLEQRNAFFRSLLPIDEAALIDAAPSTERAALKELLAELHAPLLAEPSQKQPPVHLLALGDCLMNEIRVFLPNRARMMEIPLDMRVLYFSAAMNRGLSIDEVLDYLGKNRVDLIAMSFLTFEGIPGYSALLKEADRLPDEEAERRVAALIAVIRDFIDGLRKHCAVPFLIHDAGGLPLTSIRRRIPFMPCISRGRRKVLGLLNQALADLVAGLPKCALVSESVPTRQHGHRACSRPLIPKHVVGQGLFHTSVFGSMMSEQYLPIVQAYYLLRKAKLLLVDFDNTLWKGVMADGAVEQYVERQRLLRRLKEAGIVLAAISKNSPENVRWEEMLLKPEDFVSLKINWNLKPQSVQEIAAELNLGMDSFVLLDDNPVEIDLIRQACPGVIGLNSLAEETWTMLERLFLFPNTQDTEESRARTEMYRAQVARQKSISGDLDYPQMMRSLDLRVTFGKANHKDLERLNELVNRTNQFNTTTIRFSKTELERCLRDGATRVYVADLQDKFGALGLVAAAIVTGEVSERVVELFVMSCRAMGFGLENLVLRKIVEAEGGETTKIIGRFVPSDRNMPAALLFKNNSFERVNETDWHLPSVEAMPFAPEWFTVRERA